MLPMTKKARAAAKSLAIAYHAYFSAVRDCDDNGIIVWASILLDRQEKIGVEMLPAEHLEYDIEEAKRRMDRAAAAA